MKSKYETTEEGVKILEDLMKKTGIENQEDLFNNAVAVLGWVVMEALDGRDILSTKERQFDHLLSMPFLDHIARTRPQ